MSAAVNKEIQLEIAHVLFIDIVGYSKLSINEQRAAVDELNEVVRASGQFQKAEAGARLIKIPTGDGMALVFYTSPEAPAQCAVEISRALKEHPRLQLRMGVHSGPVSGVIDVNGQANLAGAGLNMAQRRAAWVTFVSRPRRDESEALHLCDPAPLKRESPLPETSGIRLLACTNSARSLTERCEPFLLGDYLRQARNTTVQVWTVEEGFGIGSEFHQTGCAACAANNFRDHEVLFRSPSLSCAIASRFVVPTSNFSRVTTGTSATFASSIICFASATV
jgi:hypothetical protein